MHNSLFIIIVHFDISLIKENAVNIFDEITFVPKIFLYHFKLFKIHLIIKVK